MILARPAGSHLPGHVKSLGSVDSFDRTLPSGQVPYSAWMCVPADRSTLERRGPWVQALSGPNPRSFRLANRLRVTVSSCRRILRTSGRFCAKSMQIVQRVDAGVVAVVEFYVVRVVAERRDGGRFDRLSLGRGEDR